MLLSKSEFTSLDDVRLEALNGVVVEVGVVGELARGGLPWRGSSGRPVGRPPSRRAHCRPSSSPRLGGVTSSGSSSSAGSQACSSTASARRRLKWRCRYASAGAPSSQAQGCAGSSPPTAPAWSR